MNDKKISDKANHENKWEDLIARHLCDELSESEKERLVVLLDSDPTVRQELVEQTQWETRIADVLREKESGAKPDSSASEFGYNQLREQSTSSPQSTRMNLLSYSLLAISASIIIAITTNLYFQQPATDPPIAKVVGLSGSLIWTGDGGQIVRDLTVGSNLSGGTIEGMAPDSWFELEFNDGSTVMISGNSMLTFSDNGQKELRLKEGSFSANIVPQPKDKPMLVHTRTALLKVLGTQFDVQASLASTVLNVSEGKVQLLRLSDNSKLDVPAKHRVIATADREMTLERVPDSVNHWKSHIDYGPKRMHGEWFPATKTEPAYLKTVPYTLDSGKTLYTSGFPVSIGNNPPVVLQPNSQFRVRGHINSPHPVWFGITLRYPNGEFAGRFQNIRPAKQFKSGQEFDVLLNLADYHLDPSLNNIKHKLPSEPYEMIVETVWCHSLYDQAGLAIHSIELIAQPELETQE